LDEFSGCGPALSWCAFGTLSNFYLQEVVRSALADKPLNVDDESGVGRLALASVPAHDIQSNPNTGRQQIEECF
jgi:hypothetical protein